MKNKEQSLLGTNNDLPSIGVAVILLGCTLSRQFFVLASSYETTFSWNFVSGMLPSPLTMSDWISHGDVKTPITRKRHHCQMPQPIPGTKSPRRWSRRMTRICSISLSTPWSDRHIEPGAWSRKVPSLDMRSHISQVTRRVDPRQQERKELNNGGGRTGEY